MNTSDTPARHEKPKVRNPLTRLGLWLIPTAVVALVMSALAGAYLGGVLNATDNIADFPIAIVHEDSGATLPDGTAVDAGDEVASGLLAGIDPDQFDVRELTMAEAEEQMDDGSLYGAIVLPSTLSADLVAWADGSLAPGDEIAQPEVTMLTNPRAGTSAVSMASNAGTTALDAANQQLGTQLTSMVAQSQEQAGSTTPLAATAAAALSAPLHIVVEPYNPLPAGTGIGLSAFYYALLLVLAGFTGSIAANTLIDSRLGFLPTEFGPLYRLEKNSGVSRRATLITKWGVGAVIAVVVSALYLAIAAALGMPIDDPFMLWLFGAVMVFAISVVVQAINALAGNAGMVINLLVFIALGLPSAGGTIPVEALPSFFRWLSSFEPMHQVYLGARSLLYLDGTWDSGLGRSMVAAGIMVLIGLVIGLIGVGAYDRRNLTRGEPGATPAATTVGP
jgi:YhgE/Pip-like protein